MLNRKKMLCHYDLVRYITEKNFVSSVGKEGVLSLCEGKRTETMIFLGKEEDGENYEVRVYKARPKTKYIPHKSDKLIAYKETDEYDSFIFDSFDKGIEFIDFLPEFHKEYSKRPVREIINKI